MAGPGLDALTNSNAQETDLPENHKYCYRRTKPWKMHNPEPTYDPRNNRKTTSTQNVMKTENIKGRTQNEKTPKTDPGKRCGDCRRKLTQGDHGWRRPQGYEILSGSLNVVPYSANASLRLKSHCDGEHYTDGQPNRGSPPGHSITDREEPQKHLPMRMKRRTRTGACLESEG